MIIIINIFGSLYFLTLLNNFPIILPIVEENIDGIGIINSNMIKVGIDLFKAAIVTPVLTVANVAQKNKYPAIQAKNGLRRLYLQDAIKHPIPMMRWVIKTEVAK